MSTLAIVSVISMLGWLVLMIASYRSYDVPGGKALRQIAIWVALFAIAGLIFRAFTGA